MRNKLASISKNSRTITVFFLINLVFFVIFWIWFLTDIPLTKWGKTTVTTSNVIEAVFLTKRDILHDKVLNSIQKITNNQLKRSLLIFYIKLNSADQWWHPLFVHKRRAIDILVEYYLDQSYWEELIDLADYFLEHDDRQAKYYFKSGLGSERLGDLEQAENRYWQALEIESTHRDTLMHLLPILINQGNYNDVNRAIIPTEKIYKYVGNEICLYWGENNFSEKNKYCGDIGSLNKNETFKVYFSRDKQKNVEVLKKLRIDIPKHKNAIVNKIKIVGANGDNLLIFKNISNWTPNQLNIQENTLISVGSDPYIYTDLEQSLSLSSVNHISLSISLVNKADEDGWLELTDNIKQHLDNVKEN